MHLLIGDSRRDSSTIVESLLLNGANDSLGIEIDPNFEDALRLAQCEFRDVIGENLGEKVLKGETINNVGIVRKQALDAAVVVFMREIQRGNALIQKSYDLIKSNDTIDNILLLIDLDAPDRNVNDAIHIALQYWSDNAKIEEFIKRLMNYHGVNFLFELYDLPFEVSSIPELVRKKREKIMKNLANDRPKLAE